MNGLPPPSNGRPRSNGASASPPKSSPTRSSAGKSRRNTKRRLEHAEDSSSSESGGDGSGGGGNGRKRQPGVKRACNECRQQKLKCDVVTEPQYVPCERCRRLRLQCKIDSNFKRVGKRSRHAEMEREIEELKTQLASYGVPAPKLHNTQTQSTPSRIPNIKTETIKTEPGNGGLAQVPAMDTFMGSEEAVASLMDLASGQEGGSFMRSPDARLLMSRRLGDVALGQDQVHELFQIYFSFYHPYLPILNDAITQPDSYYNSSKLLFWTIICIAARKSHTTPLLLAKLAPHFNSLLWEQVREVPQNYLFVKALCLLCTWPMPVSSTSTDQTYMLSGVSMHVAMAIGLHRPSHVQDFSKFKLELMDDELRDRVWTWAACNAVAQRVATGYGQLPTTFYDWTLNPTGIVPSGFKLPKDAQNRLAIERFSSRITQALYRNDADMVGLATEETRLACTKMFETDYKQVGKNLIEPDQFSWLYLKAAYVHFRLSIFFASPDAKDYNDGLLALWNAATDFLQTVFGIRTAAGEISYQYTTNYVLQIMLASAFTLLKLLNSFFASFIDATQGRKLLTRTIKAIREISIPPNDLPSRLAEVLSQLWRGSVAASKTAPTSPIENSLQLKVKCRMSMSLVFDSVWRWREEFQAKGRGNLDTAARNPTNPDSNVESSATSVADASTTTLMPGDTRGLGISGAGGPGTLTPGLRAGTPQPEGWNLGESYNDVFDPLNWMFDGYIDFPSYTMPMMPNMEPEESL